MKNIKMNQKGITLVALVVIIIILLILAGISIATLTGSGLFEKARLAEQESKNKQEEEQGILGDYENKINDYISNTRQESSSSKRKSLINKDDGVYDKTQEGYLFDIPTTYNESIVNTLTLTESILNYDYLVIEYDGLASYGWDYYNIKWIDINTIKERAAIGTWLMINAGDGVHSRLHFAYQEDNSFKFWGRYGTGVYTKIRIIDIKGIKF